MERGRGKSNYRQNWRGRFQNHKWRKGNERNFGDNGRKSQPPNSSSQLQTPDNTHLMRKTFPKVPCPYKGWQLYMKEKYNEKSETVHHLKAFEDYFHRNLDILKGSVTSFHIDLQLLCSDEIIKERIPDAINKFIDSPQKMINTLGLAAHQTISVLKLNLESETDPDVESDFMPFIQARISHLDKITSLKNLKANYYGKLIAIKGTVVRVSNIKPLCRRMCFNCLGCNGLQAVDQPEGKYVMPSSCQEENCQSRSFTPNRPHPLTVTVVWQSLRLQEIINDDQSDGGRVPKTVECELTEDLVDSCIPGDVVTLTGIVKDNQNDENAANKAAESIFLLYVDVNSVTNCKSGHDSATAAGIEFSIKDYYAIQTIESEPELFKLLVASLCPAIYGHEMVKAGLLLCLFGGSSKGDQDVPVRGEPHILVVGDPGLGKSQMLQACSNVAPRGVYVCGNTTTTAGLTVTLSRETGSDYAIEGGALVMADQGICCIDEFDKMTNQHQALLEAMEQQSISIAKAGIVCSLPARTSILAAANPVGGHYNKAKTVSENIKMSGPLLSRFDLVFIILDKADEEMDNLLSEHVLAMQASSSHTISQKTGSGVRRQDLLNTSVTSTQDMALSEKLKYLPGNNVDRIPPQLVRKYICYARKYVSPKLSVGAAKVIQTFYLELRQKLQNSDSTPITTRQLESLIRLSEARARCELREEVTENDAKEVVEIMKFSMIDTYSDDFGVLDFQRSQHGSGISNRSQMKKFISGLQKLSDSTYKTLFSMDEMKQLSRQLNIQVRDFGDFVATLNLHGILLKKGQNIYQLLT